jgi:hypothetical protein
MRNRHGVMPRPTPPVSTVRRVSSAQEGPADDSPRRSAGRRRRARRPTVTFVLLVVLLAGCCCWCFDWQSGAVRARLAGAARPDLDSASVIAARATAERRIAQVVAAPTPTGATKVGEGRQASCYPGSHTVKTNDDFDNICISRRTVYLSVHASTLMATLATTARQLIDDDWWARRGWADEGLGLTDPDVLTTPSPGTAPQSMGNAEYDRDDDHLEIMFGPCGTDIPARVISWQEIHARVWDPYWNDTRKFDEVTLRAAVGRAGGDAVIAVAAERVWFRNG